MRGRYPDDAAAKAAKGDTGHRPEKPQIEDKTADAGDAPRWLEPDAARAIWAQLSKDMASSRLIRRIDANVFGRYCRYMCEWIDLDTRLRDLGSPVYETDTKHGRMQRLHPLFNARDRIESNLIKLEEHLGLTPRSRMAIIAHLAGAQPSLPGFENTPAEPLPQDDDDSIGFLSSRPN